MDGPLGIVDMGSNGIRFSILASLTRHLPILFEERAAISLFDAQHQKGSPDSVPIPQDTIAQVITSMQRFKSICSGYGVKTVRVLATEATRTAKNSVEFRELIKVQTGWEVELLSKSAEAEISSFGVMASFHSVKGLVMDLGGGSVELTYVVAENDHNESSKYPISLPYGAAALAKRLENCKTPEERLNLAHLLIQDFKDAYEKTQVPTWLTTEASKSGGFDLYLSGGGFRALGYIAMSKMTIKDRPYPTQIINGLSIPADKFVNIVQEFSEPEQIHSALDSKFRLSKRRISFLPATALMVSSLLQALPPLRNVLFSEGGVRQGLSYSLLPISHRSLDPLTTGIQAFLETRTLPHQRLSQDSFMQVLSLLQSSLPEISIPPRIMAAAVQLSLLHATLAKESRAAASLGTFLTGGEAGLVELPGLSHVDRAMLGLILCWRYGGVVADTHSRKAVQRVVRDGSQGKKKEAKRQVQECKWLGRILELIFTIYTGGLFSPKQRLGFSASFQGKAWAVNVHLPLTGQDPNVDSLIVQELVAGLGKGFGDDSVERLGHDEDSDEDKGGQKADLPIQISVTRS